MNREDALKKVKKCLALAKSSNEHESATALRQAQALMREYQLTDFEVSASDIKEVRVRAQSSCIVAWENRLVNRICGAFGTERFFDRQYDEAGNLRTWYVFIGFPSSVEIAAYAYEILSRQCAKARREHVSKQKRCKPATKTARGDAFAWGWVDRVARLIHAFAQPIENRQLLLSYVKHKHPELRIIDAKDRIDKKSDSHIHAGWHAGANAELNRGVGNSQQHHGLLT